jgi:hypothetical protein
MPQRLVLVATLLVLVVSPNGAVQGQTAETPPTFIFATTTDATVPVENSVTFYLALKRAGVLAEPHVFGEGADGVGLDLGDPALGLWPKLLEERLRGRGLLGALPAPGASR